MVSVSNACLLVVILLLVILICEIRDHFTVTCRFQGGSSGHISFEYIYIILNKKKERSKLDIEIIFNNNIYITTKTQVLITLSKVMEQFC